MTLNINNSKYELTAVNPDQYPVSSIPEVAFVGRSNVGKSSIINSLLNRKSLAKVGATPGMTRVINFYNIDEKLYFVDLPGYGYASVSKNEKEFWGKIIETYLLSRHQLKLVILLVDIRHKPSEDDKLMHHWMQSNNLPYIVVMTKADKISRSQVQLRRKEIINALDLPQNIPLVPYSSLTKNGKDELWKEINAVIDEGV